MTVDDLLAAFRAAVAQSTISPALVPGVESVLAPLGITALPLANGDAAPSGADAVLTGGTVFLNGVAWDLRLTGTAGTPATYALRLQAAAGTPWTFGRAFPALPQSRYAPPRGNRLVVVDSVIAPLQLDQATLSVPSGFPPASPAGPPTVRIEGALIAAGSALEIYDGFFGVKTLWAAGSLTFVGYDATNPLLLVDAVAPGAKLVLGDGDVTVSEVGVRLRNDYPDPFTLGDVMPLTSIALLYAKIALGTPPLAATIEAPLQQADFVWPFRVTFAPPKPTLTDGINAILALFNGITAADLAIPPGVAPLELFRIDNLDFNVVPQPDSFVPDFDSCGITLVSATPWDPPIPFVVIQTVGTRWIWQPASQVLSVAGSVWGTLLFGSQQRGSLGAFRATPELVALEASTSRIDQSPGPVALLISVSLPTLVLSASTQGPIVLAPAAAFSAYFEGPTPNVGSDLTITSIAIEADLPSQTYGASLKMNGLWSFRVRDVTFAMEELFFQVFVSQNAVAGLINGTFTLQLRSGLPARFVVNAEYPGDGSWTFSGGLLNGSLDVVDMIFAFLGETPSVSVPSITITNLWATYSTGAGNPFAVRASLEARWTPELLEGLTLSLVANAAIARRAPANAEERALVVARPNWADNGMITAGAVSGTFTVNRLAITAGLSFVDTDTTYLLRVMYGTAGIEASTGFVQDGDKRVEVITFRLIGVTLGSIVEYFIGLANPNANYVLEAPWSFLNAIDLSAVTVKVAPQTQKIWLDYAIDLTLPFIHIASVGLVYDRSTSEPTVNFTLRGNFLGQDYTTKPLTWDALNDAPPQVPGKGNQLIDLRYLGFGQHVTLSNLLEPDSIADVLATLRAEMQPVADPSVNPLQQPSGDKLRFDESSRWMIGLDLTLMDTVSIGLVLHDPDLYGVLIKLAGEQAGSLAGLSFELLYKKVSADIGVFHVRLQVPDAFRQLQFGAVSVTLGIITVDVFTNGNFLIDLGFPHNRNYDVSFGLQAGIFIGRGGVYFGLLNGTTSKRVPQITNGSFDPVLELGVGFAVGVGRTFEKGPLKAGLYVELEVIFEGVLAWFHPSDAGAPAAMYYWCRGTAALVGKLYGSVDFKIVSASVSVEAYASITLTLAAYEATLVELDVGVEVSASIKILFVRFSFSFSMNLQASFTIGSSTTPPWTIAAGQSSRSQARLTGAVHAPRRRRASDVAFVTRNAYLAARHGVDALFGTAELAADPCASYHLVFDPSVAVFPGGGVRSAAVTIVPAFTVADVPVNWSGVGLPPDNPDPAYRIAFLLTAEGATPPDATTIAESRAQTAAHSALAGDPSETAFNTIAEAMLRWSISALGVDPVNGEVSLGQLQELLAQLDCEQTESNGFSYLNLSAFFATNMNFVVSGPPSGTVAPMAQPGVPFPMIPLLRWTSADLPPYDNVRDFGTYQPVDATYEREVTDYFRKLQPGKQVPQPLGDPLEAGTESMATYVFRDYFLLVAKAAVQSSIDLLTAYPHVVAPADSLDTIARSFPPTTAEYAVRAGDTIEQVAQWFGYSALEIAYWNPTLALELAANPPPGTRLTVTLGVTPESIASANVAWPLTAALPFALGALDVQVRENETIAALAARLGIDANAWLGERAPGSPPSLTLLNTTGLLREGATLAFPALSYANPLGLDVETVAAVYYVRLNLGEVPLADWYAQAIVQLNGAAIGADGRLPAVVVLPPAYGVLSPPLSPLSPISPLSPPALWQTLPGDTLTSVAGYAALLQNPVAGSTFATFASAVLALNPSAPPAPVLLPPIAYALPGGATLASLATLLLLDLGVAAQAAAFAALVLDANVLAPLAVVTAPDVTGTIAPEQTLLSLAQQYGISVEDLGARLASTTGLLAVVPLQFLIVPNVPQIGLPALLAALLGVPPPASPLAPQQSPPPGPLGANASTISGQVSRFMLYGLRIPAPVLGSDGRYHIDPHAMTSLYELIGQQLPGPAPASPLDAVALTLSLTSSAQVPWLTFAETTTAAHGESPELLAARHAQLDALNPALRIPGRLAPGLVLYTNTAYGVTIEITQAELLENYPAAGLVPDFEGGLAPMPLYRDVPVEHGLRASIPWQTPVPLALPVPPYVAPATSGMPTIWPFPGDLLQAAASDSAVPYRLWRTDAQAGPVAPPVEVTGYAWATTVDVRIRAIPGLANAYEVFGADTAGRQVLLEAIRYLGANPSDPGTVQLLFALSPAAGMPPGLSSASVDPALTYLVKTNLTTETRSGAQPAMLAAFESPPAALYFASIAAATNFLTLLWECSVVGGGGYWLVYTAAGGGALPASIFAADGSATLTVLLTLASQMEYAPPKRPARALRTFNDCALVEPGIDPSAVSLFARADGDAETVRTPTVGPGQVGFTLDLHRPPPLEIASPLDPQTVLRKLYSLVGYQLLATAAFGASDEGMPLGPQTKTPGAEDVWHLARVVPMSRFALAHPLPPVPAFPSPLTDPYAGIDALDTPSGYVIPQTVVQLWFHDLLGNASAASAAQRGSPVAFDAPAGQVTLDVGYTDPVIGPSSWPATTVSYTVGVPPNSPPDSPPAPNLTVTLSAQGAAFLPGYAQRGDALAEQALEQRARFAQIYYQLMQPDAGTALFTTLESNSDGTLRALPPVSVDALRQFAIAAYAWLGASAAVTRVPVDAAAYPTLDDAVAAYGIDDEALGLANTDTTVSQLLAVTALAVPQFAVFAAGSSVASLLPPSFDPITVLQDDDNTVLPLNAGVELVVPATLRPVVADPVTHLTPALNELASALNCTVATLVQANRGVPSLLTPGFAFVCAGVTVRVGVESPPSEATLDGVASTFASSGVPFDAVMVAGANADVPGMFRDGAQLAVTGYVVGFVVAGGAPRPESLENNRTGVSPDTLAALNAGTVDLFPAGTPVFVTTIPDASQLGVPLGVAAATYGVTAGDLLRHNGGAAPGAAMAVPGQSRLALTARIPYAMRANDTLDAIAAAFANATALSLAAENENVPATIAGDQSVTAGGQVVPTQAGDSFASLLARFSPAIQLDQLVTAIAATPGYLAAGTTLLTPPATLPGAASPPASPLGGITPNAAAAAYGVSAEALLTANAATADILIAGSVLQASDAPAARTQQVAAHDSLVGVVRRFALAGVVTSVAQLASANATVPFLQPGALLLLAPAGAALATELGAQGGYHFPSAIFPIHVYLDVTRDAQLVLPEFRGTFAQPGPAVRSRTAIPAARNASGANGLTLDTFATQVQSALPGLRVATGKVLSEQREVAGTDVWAVVFAPGFIANVAVQPPVHVPSLPAPQPRCYALRPIATSLSARADVEVQSFDRETGNLVYGTTRNYQGIDLDTWARAFLAGVEVFLSAAYAAPAYVANDDALAQVLDAKALLARSIARGLEEVLDVVDAQPDADALASAQGALEQRLLANLASGFATASIFQYDTTVQSPWPTEWARLSGAVTILEESPVSESLTSAGVSVAKTSLQNGASFVNVALELAEPGRERNVTLPLAYVVNELEFAIADVNGYESSEWLSFVQPLAHEPPAALHVDLGTPTIPIPLRAYPPMPALTQQDAEAPLEPLRLDDALHWSYVFTYAHQSSAQDQAHLEVEFNRPTQFAARARRSLLDDLFGALAQYAEVSADLWSVLNVLRTPDPSVPASTVSAAAATFARLAARIAGAWNAHWPAGFARTAAAPQGELYEYRVTLGTDTGERFYDTLTLELVTGGAIAWPSIACTLPDGSTVPLVHVSSSDPNAQLYRFPLHAAPAFARLAFTYRFAGLHVADYQSALSRVWVVRNQFLLADGTQPGPATNADFVYRTPAVAFPQPVVPLLSYDTPFPIGVWSTDPNPLVAAFDTIFDGDAANREISCRMSFGYDLVIGPDPIETVLPVAFKARFPYDAATPAEIATVLHRWYDAMQPALDAARWVFGVTLYSAVDANLDRPVLDLRRLVSPISPTSPP